MSDWQPLIGTVIGGLLAVVGGFVANYFLQMAARKADQRRTTSERLEDAYALTAQVQMWTLDLMRDMTRAYTGSGVSKAADDPPIQRLEMILRIYEPSLVPLGTEYIASVTALRKNAVEFWRAVAAASRMQERPKPELLDTAFAPASNLEQLSKTLSDAIVQAVRSRYT